MASTEVLIDDLSLDLDNPRYTGLTSQKDALEKIVVNQGKKLVNLADDIINEGLSPGHRMLVIKIKGGKGKYTVLDGNRRLAALKILVNPSVLDPMRDVGDVTKKQLRGLAHKFNRTSIEPVDVYVCKDEEEARHWIEAIHTGENEGRGVVGWDGMATARFRGKTSSLKVLEFIKSHGKLNETELSHLERFPITNLDRLVGTPEVRERLGLSFEDGQLASDLPQQELLRSLRRIVTDIGAKKINVSKLKSRDDRINYIKSLGAALPDLAKRTGTAVSLEKMASGGVSGKASTKSTGAKTRSLINRKALIPPQSQCKLEIDVAKLQELCQELRRLPLDSFPIAIGVLFRVFLELTLDHYGTKHLGRTYSIDAKLNAKISLVADKLALEGVHKRDLQPFRALAGSTNKALSVDRFHGFVHSRYALPSSDELRRGWDEIGHVFQAIWK